MTDQTLSTFPAPTSESEIELLARQTDTAVGTVKEIYRAERDKLERSARIKTFIPVLAHRRVKAILEVERGKRQ